MRGSPVVPDAVGRRSFSLSSYGFVSVPARNANLEGLRLRIRVELEGSRLALFVDVLESEAGGGAAGGTAPEPAAEGKT